MAMVKDDAEYVGQVMASQSILHVKSNDYIEGTSNARKRRLSSDNESENGVPARKEKPDNEFAELLRVRLTQLQPDLSKTLDEINRVKMKSTGSDRSLTILSVVSPRNWKRNYRRLYKVQLTQN